MLDQVGKFANSPRMCPEPEVVTHMVTMRYNNLTQDANDMICDDPDTIIETKISGSDVFYTVNWIRNIAAESILHIQVTYVEGTFIFGENTTMQVNNLTSSEKYFSGIGLKRCVSFNLSRRSMSSGFITWDLGDNRVIIEITAKNTIRKGASGDSRSFR